MHKLAVLILGAVVILAGCSDDACVTLDLYTCPEPDIGHLDSKGEPDPCHHEEDACLGECVPVPPFGGWEPAALLWFGPWIEAPDCPADRAPIMAYEGFADPADLECPECRCAPPSGECELSSTLTAHTTVTCTGMALDFSAPEPWNGACTNLNPVPAAFNPKSVRVEAMTLTESGCAPITPPPPRSDSTDWKTFARACRGAWTPCVAPGMFCVPEPPPPPPGFSQCLYRAGDELECPPAYPNRHNFYNDLDDQRSCTACACAPPEGSQCSTMVALYEVANCLDDNPAAAGTVGVNLTAQCLPLGDSTALVSKNASDPLYAPGSCEPLGGEVAGTVKLKGASTFCCQ